MTETTAPIRPTVEFLAKFDVAILPPNMRGEQLARVETQTQLDRYERRKSLYLPRAGDTAADVEKGNAIRAEAGRMYFKDAYYSGTVPRAKPNGFDRVNGGTEDASEEAIARHIAVKTKRAHAIRALGDLVAIVEWVCVDDHSAQTYAIRRGEHPMAGIALLRVALTQLAKHYGILKVQ